MSFWPRHSAQREWFSGAGSRTVSSSAVAQGGNVHWREAVPMAETDVFKHSTPSLYDRYMGPLLFEPYAQYVAERVALLRPERILETAAGTGIVTRAVSEAVPEATIVATDINPAVVEFAAQHVHSERVTFQRADAQDLPFDDATFDLVLCLFGVMFFPDKIRANAEARRVLQPGGRYVLVTFDRLDLNPIPKEAGEAVATLFPDDPRYMERGPFSYTDPALVEQDLRAAGFEAIELETVELSSRVIAQDAAHGIVLGSPFRAEIERLDESALERAATAVDKALRAWDGTNAPMSAHIATATR
jgi:ubiquinone/menaquinone biosynthesis C-methylase UbiE